MARRGAICIVVKSTYYHVSPLLPSPRYLPNILCLFHNDNIRQYLAQQNTRQQNITHHNTTRHSTAHTISYSTKTPREAYRYARILMPWYQVSYLFRGPFYGCLFLRHLDAESLLLSEGHSSGCHKIPHPASTRRRDPPRGTANNLYVRVLPAHVTCKG